MASMQSHLASALDFEVAVSQGAVMLPAEVPADDRIVTALLGELESLGRQSISMYSSNTFDAGYGCSQGIPTVMFGPGKRSFGAAMTGTEWVLVHDCFVASQAMSGLILRYCS